MDVVIIFLIVTFLFLLSGFPVAFILSGISLLFAFIGILFGFFDYSYLMAFPYLLFGIPYYTKDGKNQFIFKSQKIIKKVTLNILKKKISYSKN